MVVIRLSRGGAKKRPFYRILVADSRVSRDGGYLERIGYFNPIATGKEKRLELDRDRMNYWIKNGAQPSERVKKLLFELEHPEILEKRKARSVARKTRKKAKIKSEAEAAAKEEIKEEKPAAQEEK